MAWTDEMVADLRRMWAEGLTTGEIAKRLDVSKNSIVGKVHRLGLSGRPSPIKKKAEAEVKTEVRAPAAKAAKKEKPAAKPVQVVMGERPKVVERVVKQEKPVKKESEIKQHKDGTVKVADLDMHTCRWPIGDPKDEKFHFCGKRVRLGQTYCEEHAETAYVKQAKK